MDVLDFLNISEEEMLVGAVGLRVCEEYCGSVDEKIRFVALEMIVLRSVGEIVS